MTRRSFLQAAIAAAVALPASRLAHSSTPSPWQIGCYTRPWDQHEYQVALDAIAEAGFKHVGLMTTKSPTRLVISAATTINEAQRIGEACRQRGLAIASVYGGDIPAARSLDAAVDALRRLIDNCAAAGAANLLMGGTGDPRAHDTYYQAIAACCEQAARHKLGISVKPHGGLNATGPQCRQIIERVGHPSFRIWYDPGNIYYYSDGKLNPVDDSATVDGLVAGISIKDYRHPRNVNLTPGTGQVDFPAVMARLRKGGFTAGPLIIETLATGDLKQTLEEAKKAKAFVEGLVAI